MVCESRWRETCRCNGLGVCLKVGLRGNPCCKGVDKARYLSRGDGDVTGGVAGVCGSGDHAELPDHLCVSRSAPVHWLGCRREASLDIVRVNSIAILAAYDPNLGKPLLVGTWVTFCEPIE